MSGLFRKKKVEKALERARRLEKHKPMSKKKVVKVYKQGISFGEKLKRFLEPSWFVKGTGRPAQKKKPKKAKIRRAAKKKKPGSSSGKRVKKKSKSKKKK